MKIVYVVTSRGQDIYSAMARLSVASVRLMLPTASVAVVCDAETNRSVQESGDRFPREVDEWISCETPNREAVFRSRYLKTSLRQRIGGDFLFLDVDTIVRGDLSPVFQCAEDFAGAPNHSRERLDEQIWTGDQAILDEMRWETGQAFYMNSGVLWVADTEGAHCLYKQWHANWLASQERVGDCRDQPALNTALLATNVSVARLAARFNAQIGAFPPVAKDAVVWHYNCSLGWQEKSRIDHLLASIMQDNAVNVESLRKLMESQRLWPAPFWKGPTGRAMIAGSVRDLVKALDEGADADSLFLAMRGVDRHYAGGIVRKLLADTYWGEHAGGQRLALRLLLRYMPLAGLREPARSCLLHRLLRKGKRFRPSRGELEG